MSKESWETLECDESFPEEDSEHRPADTEPQVRLHDAPKDTAPAMSLICPDTGKVTMQSTHELRAQLQQLRAVQNTHACDATHQVRPRGRSASTVPVAVDDEFRGPDDEWLVVEDATPDGEVFTLCCLQTGARRTRTASAVLADIGRRGLKVHRPGMPYVPPELEEDPRVFVDEDGFF